MLAISIATLLDQECATSSALIPKIEHSKQSEFSKIRPLLIGTDLFKCLNSEHLHVFLLLKLNG